MKLTNVLVVYMNGTSSEHKKVLKTVKSTLKKLKIKFDFINRNKIKKSHFRNRNMIISIGGDGTFLKTAHFIDDKTPAFGVNADPSKKEGFFTSSNRKNFEKKIITILSGKNFRVIKLTRLESKIGNRKLETSLNEIYIGHSKPYSTVMYDLKIGGRVECQKSSGVLIGTASGSHAWLSSAGGRRLPKQSKKFQLVVREPYFGRLTKPKIVHKIFNPNEKIKIFSKTKDSIVVVDSLSREYPFKIGKKLTITVSDSPLRTIVF